MSCENDFALEIIDADMTDIQLVSSAVECTVCDIGSIVKTGRETTILLYTRQGSKGRVQI